MNTAPAGTRIPASTPPPSRRRQSGKTFAVVLLIPVLGIAGVVGAGWIGSNRALSPGTSTYGWSLADYPDLHPEPVVIRSTTGAQLAARFLPGRTRATVVVSHGYGGTQEELLPLTAALNRTGLSVLSYDLRGCGGSTGRITFGALEQQDLRSVVDYLQTRPDVDRERIGAFGFSMGAATTLMAAADDTRIRAVVADSAWSEVDHWFRPSWTEVLTRPMAQFTPVSRFLLGRRTGVDLDALRPVDRVARISPRPLLLIATPADQVVPAADTDRLFAAAGEPKQIWQIEGEGHGATTRHEAFDQRVTAFFTTHLQSGRPASTG